MASARVVGVLLAAGQGTRFGGNKLEALLDGEMLGLLVAQTLAGLGLERLVAVCNPGCTSLNAALAGLGFEVSLNLQPEAGLSTSLRIAVEQAGGADAMLIALADMPFVPASHFAALISASDAERSVASSLAGQKMPPALFPRAMFPALLAAEGDVGARGLLAGGLAVEGNAAMLADVDTRADLALMQG
jgi:molybdenum cofactor cytidylyltransferase